MRKAKTKISSGEGLSMGGNIGGRKWEAVCESVRGASHIAAERPNQDALKIARFDSGTTVVAAVADGHGGANYIRSEVGSRLAVTVATEELHSLLQLPAKRLLAFHRTELEDILANRIVRRWLDRVGKHNLKHPFCDAELATTPALQQDATLAYGTTLLAAAANDRVALFVQIGDGDILTVSPRGGVSRPFERDPRLIGNETVSLCLPDAARQVRVGLKALNREDYDSIPVLILLSTDGYSNCFKDENAFAQVGKDYLDLLEASNGTMVVRKNLRTWLRQASDQYSRDDITVAMLYRRSGKRGGSTRAAKAAERIDVPAEN
jgi:serine/threonine protein phosphatase PrpC